MSILINIGMWFERFVIIVISLHRDYLPSSWSMYKPTITEIGIFVGTLGIFFTCFLLFVRFFPVIAIAEVKSILKSSNKKYLDKQRTNWRKRHRTLNGRIIIYPDKPPEHINARASKLNNWFWKKILLNIKTQEIPAIISGIKSRIKSERDIKKFQLYNIKKTVT